jgi:hypothetical protein
MCASLPGNSGNALVMSGVTTACTSSAEAAKELQAITTAGTRVLKSDMAESSVGENNSSAGIVD